MGSGASSPRPGSAPVSPGGHPSPPAAPTARPPPLTLQQFVAVMEQALATVPRPRTYLNTSPLPKQPASHSFRPAINQRSKAMAARLRPADAPYHEVLHQTAAATREKLEVGGLGCWGVDGRAGGAWGMVSGSA